jgi:threonine aldolase
MRRAMAEAEVGDDVFGEDPTVRRLEEESARRLGMEAALFVPTGTMGNQIAVNLHTRPGQEVILEERSHVYNYELAAMAALSGVIPRPVAARRGILRAEDVAGRIAPPTYYLSQTGLITLENTHNMAGGTVFPHAETDKILALAKERRIPVHLDGARLFNAAAALGCGVKDLARGFDSVMFCFSKGLAAPVGSMLLGSKDFMERARVVRKRFGGGMRQAGVLAAACLVALDTMTERLVEDHRHAKKLAEGLSRIKGLGLAPEDVETNIVIFGVSGLELDSGVFLARLREKGVLGVPVSASHVRFVTHCGVSAEDVERALAAVESAARA